MKTSLYSVILLLAIAACQQEESVKVVATSSWTAAYVRLAGIEEVDVLAPATMQHPTEYELNFEDIQKIRTSELIVCGGYEIMMDKVRTGLKIKEDRILEIKTDYSMDNIYRSVMEIAAVFGTEVIAEANMDGLKGVFEESRIMIKAAGLQDELCLVQFFLQPLSKELGLNISGVFGPAHLEIFDIQELMKKEFSLILDNAHNPVAGPLIESSEDVKTAYLINFPGKHGTRSLEDVINYNVGQILDAGKGM